MRSIFTCALAILPALVSGTPVQRDASAEVLTGAFDCLGAGAYTLCQNQWGARTSFLLLFGSHYHDMARVPRSWCGLAELYIVERNREFGIVDDELYLGQWSEQREKL